MKLLRKSVIECVKENNGINRFHSRPVCFFLNSVMASLKVGSDFAALRASMKSFHSGVSDSGLRRFTDTSLVSSGVFCILLQHTYVLNEFINLSITNLSGPKGCLED